VFPALRSQAEVGRHLQEYFAGLDVPRMLEAGIGVADRVPLGDRVAARVARRNIMRMAQQFIVGATPAEAVEGLHRLWRGGSAFTVDVLGEHTVVGAEADRYAAKVAALLTTLSDASAGWAPDDHLERDDRGPLARVNVSIKPTALATHYEPLSRDEGLAGAKERLRPVAAPRPRAGRVRQLRHGALRRQGPDARAVPRSCCPRTSSPPCPPASWSRPTCATAATTWPTSSPGRRAGPSP
jgi:RHH-type proline utilization regulon transcriptional repressor/proline dehydrogenase/delta 1-pyrroline-5-carboxylate dehydrogenase